MSEENLKAEETEKREQGNEEENEDAQKNPKKKKSEKGKKTETADLKEQIEELELKIEEQKDKYLRLYADFDNYKKRAARERLELIKDAGQDIMSVFLPVLDDFNRAMKSSENSDDPEILKEGMDLIYNKMQKALEQKGLKVMESMGKDFDPELHEALTEIPAKSEEEKGKVVDVVEEGYMLNDKI
ncbi:MAG: nucleotide exchange factor GrpE, partial [Chitinophagales bacterium]